MIKKISCANSAQNSNVTNSESPKPVDKNESAEKKMTDDEIRHELDTVSYRQTDSDWLLWLSTQTDDPELKERCKSNFSSAYHAEEYYAGML